MNGCHYSLRGLSTLVVVALGLIANLGSTPQFDWGGGGTTSVSVDPPVDNPPTYANAGPDQTVLPAALVQLDGEGADAEGRVSPQWRQETGPMVQLSSTQQWNPTFTAPIVADVTELRFLLRVFDGKGQVGSNGIDRVSIWVDPDMTPPLPVLIDFETLPDGSLPVDSQQVRDDYADLCVHFGTFDPADPSAGPTYRSFEPLQTFVWDLERVYNPPPETPFDVTLFFTVPVTSISADVFSLQGYRVVMTAYDSLGGELGSVMSEPSPPCCQAKAGTLTLSGLGAIHRTRFSTNFPYSAFPAIDNVRLERTQACGP